MHRSNTCEFCGCVVADGQSLYHEVMHEQQWLLFSQMETAIRSLEDVVAVHRQALELL